MGTVLLNNGAHLEFESVQSGNKVGYMVKVFHHPNDNPVEEYMTKTQLKNTIVQMIKELKGSRKCL